MSVIGSKIGELRPPTEIEKKLLEPEAWFYKNIILQSPPTINKSLSCFISNESRTEGGRYDMEYKEEKEKLCKVEKWRDELLRKLRNDKDMPMDEYCLRARLVEVIDGYIAIQSRLVITLEKKREENDLMEESLKTLKWWQDRLYRRIKEMI